MNYTGKLAVVIFSGLLFISSAKAQKQVITTQPQLGSIMIPTQLSLRDSALVNAYLLSSSRNYLFFTMGYCFYPRAKNDTKLLRRRPDGNMIITSRGVCAYRYDDFDLLIKRMVNSSSLATPD